MLLQRPVSSGEKSCLSFKTASYLVIVIAAFYKFDFVYFEQEIKLICSEYEISGFFMIYNTGLKLQ